MDPGTFEPEGTLEPLCGILGNLVPGFGPETLLEEFQAFQAVGEK